MTIKELLAKVANGEALTDEERATLKEYDPDRTANGAAAAARKAAEKERDALRTQLAELEEKLNGAENAGKTEVEQLKAKVAQMAKAVETATAAAAKAEGDKRALVRGTRLDRIVGGLKFVDGLDANLPRLALEKALADVPDEDLEKEETVKPILAGFIEKNKAIILDQSGGGAGTPAKGRQQGQPGSSDPAKMTDSERATQLRARK